jgi:hypothetical protein
LRAPPACWGEHGVVACNELGGYFLELRRSFP